jgi:transposase
MKRTIPPPLRLWTAAKVNGEFTMEEWFRDYALKKINLLTATTTTTTMKGLDVADFPSASKKPVNDGGAAPSSMSTFQVSILPTKNQRRVLRSMLRVSNVAYNWAGYLVTKCNFRPSQYDLQRVVARASKEEKAATAKRKPLEAIPDEHVPEFAQYLFDESVGMTQHRLLAAKEYAKDYKLCLAKKEARRKKCRYLIENGHTDEIKDRKRKELEALEGKYVVKPRPTGENITTGTFGIQKLYIKPSASSSPRHLRVLSDMFGKTELKLGKSIAKLPPIEHDVTVTKRVNGKWILNIPCSSAFLRRPITTKPTAVCGVDPGARTFLTVFDETNKEAYKLGDQSEMRILKPLVNKAKRLGDESSNAATQASRTELERDHKSLAAQKIWRRVRDKVTGIHNAIIRHFAETYAFVAIGNLSYRVVEKDMPKKSKDDLYVWRLYEFKTKLLHRFGGLDQREVVIQDERYTSKTCGLCDNVKHDLGAAKRYICDICGYDVDRDVNGARNILRRALGLWAPTK